MGLVHHSTDVFDDVGVADGDVVLFAEVRREVVQLQFTGEHRDADGLPVAPAHRLGGGALVELPVEVITWGLVLRPAEDRGQQADPVEVIGRADTGGSSRL